MMGFHGGNRLPFTFCVNISLLHNRNISALVQPFCPFSDSTGAGCQWVRQCCSCWVVNLALTIPKSKCAWPFPRLLIYMNLIKIPHTYSLTINENTLYYMYLFTKTACHSDA